MGWFNYYGLIIMLIIMVPNVIYAATHKNAAGEIFNIPYTYFNFWFNYALTIYLAVNGALCAMYLIFWAVCWKNNGKVKALALSIIPSCIFVFSGVVLANIPLIVFAVIFAANHILISYKNAD